MIDYVLRATFTVNCPQTRVQQGAGQFPPWFRHQASNPVSLHHGLTLQSFWCTHSPVVGGVGLGGVGLGGVGLGATTHTGRSNSWPSTHHRKQRSLCMSNPTKWLQTRSSHRQSRTPTGRHCLHCKPRWGCHCNYQDADRSSIDATHLAVARAVSHNGGLCLLQSRRLGAPIDDPSPTCDPASSAIGDLPRGKRRHIDAIIQGVGRRQLDESHVCVWLLHNSLGGAPLPLPEPSASCQHIISAA